jgi:hypothetical protein
MTSSLRFGAHSFNVRVFPLVLLAAAALLTAPSATAAPKKKKPSPAAPVDVAPTAPAESAPAEVAPPDAPAPATSTATSTADSAAAPTAAPEAAPPPAKPSEADSSDTREDPNTRYYFLGLKYRGTLIPQFLESVFVDDGGTLYANSISLELDMRKGGQSMIPWIQYADYGMGDTLFHQKGTDLIPGNYSVVNSGLKILYVGLDELWSVPLDDRHHWDFEFGFGVGIGYVFGDLQNNWVHEDAMGPLQAGTGVHYSKCQTTGSGPGCAPADHQNTTTAKVGGYVEQNWFNGGSVPAIFPNVWFPDVGIRYKPVKQFEARLHAGFSLTGFWFGLSGDYGFERPEDKSVKASTAFERLRDKL